MQEFCVFERFGLAGCVRLVHLSVLVKYRMQYWGVLVLQDVMFECFGIAGCNV